MNDAPARPTIPPIVWLAVAMCVGCLVGEQLSWSLWVESGTAGPVAVLCGAVVGAGALWRRFESTRVLVALVAAGLLAGAAVSLLQGAEWRRQTALAGDSGAREWTGIVEADPTPGTYGASVRLRIVGGPLDGARVRITWPGDAQTPDLGRTVRFAAILDPLPPGEDWARRVARSGACATGSAWRAEVGAWRPGLAGQLLAWRAARLEQLHDIPGVGGDLLEGIVLGDRRRLLGTSAEEDFRILGLTHLVAVSGSHLALACAAVAGLGGLLRVPRRPLILATMVAGAAYALVTGMAYSALRSLWMLGVGGIGQLVGRRGSGMASLGVAVVLVLAVEPWAIYDVGLQLSALAVGGLLLFGSLGSMWASYGLCGLRARVADLLALTCVAQAVTMPVIGSVFGVVSLLAPVANAIAGPLVSVALWLGLVGTAVGSVLPGMGMLLARAAATVLAVTAWVASGLAQLPGAAISIGGGPLMVVGAVAAAGAAWAWWPVPRSGRTSRLAAAGVTVATLALAIGPSPGRAAEMVVLDVEQGDAILVREGGRTMLVDVGADAGTLREALARQHVRRVDVLVLTHAHDDHTGGLGGMSGTVQVGWIGVPRISEANTGTDAFAAACGGMTGEPLRPLTAGDSWWIGKVHVLVLWPRGDVSTLGTNDTSIVLRVTMGEFDAVLTGDAEQAAQEGLLAVGDCTHVEVLKVPHHGSTNGLTAEGLAAWSPRDAIISVGEGNDFGHPNQETLDALAGADVRVWRTDYSGDIIVGISETSYRVHSDQHGEEAAIRARMAAACCRLCCATPNPSPEPEESRGRSRHRRAEACLSDIWRGGTPARSRAPPLARPGGRGCRSRLQLRSI